MKVTSDHQNHCCCEACQILNFGVADFNGVAGSVFGDFAFLDGKWGDARRGTPGGTVTWTFATFNADLTMTTVAARSPVFAAFDEWSRYANINFQKLPDGANADIEFAWEYIDGDSEVLGYAELDGIERFDAPDLLTDVDIRIDLADFSRNPVNDAKYDTVILHEVGHALGLDHVAKVNELMHAYAETSNPENDGGQEGLQFLYGSRPGAAATFFAGFDNQGDVFSNAGFATSLRAFGLSGNDQITGGFGADHIFSGLGNDTLRGGDGNDRLNNSFGNDRIEGDAGNDRISSFDGDSELNGGDGNDVIRAGMGDDVLRGGAGDDRLYGDAFSFRELGGRDRLDGGAGNDTMIGGPGADIFVFRPDNGLNNEIGLRQIWDRNSVRREWGPDFEAGLDKVDLRAFNFGSAENALSNFEQRGSDTYFFADNTGVTFRALRLEDLVANDILW